MLKDQIKEDLKKAMLAKDNVGTSTLRMLLSAVNYYEIQKGGAGYEATDEDLQSVIQKEVKQRRDSIDQFIKGGREDLVGQETKEMAVLEKYLPEQMSDEEIRMLVADAIKKTNAQNLQDMGKVMGVLMPQTKGKADGGIVSRFVKEALS